LEDHNPYIMLFLAVLDTGGIIYMTLPLPVNRAQGISDMTMYICIALLGLNVVKRPIIPSAWLTIAVAFKSFGHSSF